MNEVKRPKQHSNTTVKLLLAAMVLLPTLVGLLLLYIGRALFAAPGVLFGERQTVIAVLCVIGGIILLIPLVCAIGAMLINRLSAKVSR